MKKKSILDKKIFIIAEIGKNFIQTEEEKSFAEYLSNAKELIYLAKESGADAVKFQTHNLEDEQLDVNISSPHFSGSDRYSWVKRNTEITPIKFWKELKKYSDELEILFFSTPMSRGAAKILNKIGVELWKVGSGDILDFVLLDYLASTRKPIIISSGMSTLKEIDKMVNFLSKRDVDFALLHCVSKYPAKSEELNLNTIKLFEKRYKIPIGFSDHSLGYNSVLAAVNMGARIIEKHFSTSRNHWGSDHKVSMIPSEFKKMVRRIKNGEQVILADYGRRAKILNIDEKKFRPIFRKSLVAGNNLKAGTFITGDMLYAMRPQKYIEGIYSEEYENIIGKKLIRDLNKYEAINLSDFENGKKRKICFVITSKIHYSRNKLLLEELLYREDTELQIVVGASAILDKYGDVLKLLEEDGFKYNAKIVMTIEGGDSIAMAKTTGIGIVEFSTVFDNLKPDIVIIRGDRYEILSATIAAVYLNITVAHIEGGDLTGTIDESVRHAITKLSHIHFASNKESAQRIIKMGENPKNVFNFGSLDIEFIEKIDNYPDIYSINNLGVGAKINFKKPYLIVMQHPVTTEIEENESNIIETIEAIKNLGIQTVWFWPNIDAGTNEISGVIRRYREKYNLDTYVRVIKYLSPEIFISLLRKSVCLVGNSSSGIKECSYLGIPVVNIGSRQNGRLRGGNVIDVSYNRLEIETAIKQQIKHGKYKQDNIYYKKDTSKKIAKVLAKIKLYKQKVFYE